MSKYDSYKEQVLAVSKTLSEQGYFGTKSGTGGNVSVLIEGEQALVVTPSSLKYDTMTPEDLCVIGFDGKRIEGKNDPSVEAPMHTAVYKNRQDVNAVIHTHQPYASIFAVLNEPIPALFDEVTVAIGNKVEVAPYGLSGSPDLLKNVVSVLSNKCHCYLMQNHGALAIARDLDKAFNYVELLEKTAKIYYRALATGKPVSVLPDPLPDALQGIVSGKQEVEIARKASLKASS